MPAFVALLRGINVGKANRVPMADLRRLLQDLGHTNVATLLNSGNAVFCSGKRSSPKHANEIASVIERELSVDVPVVVKSSSEFSAIIDENPLATKAADPSRLLVAFTQEAIALARIATLAPLATGPDKLVIGKHAAYVHCPAGILESKLAVALLGKAPDPSTTRNWATTLKIQALLRERDG